MPFGRLKRTRLKIASKIHPTISKMLTFTNSNMPSYKHPFKALKRITAVQLNTKPSVASAEQSLNTYPPVSYCFLCGWWVLITNPWKCFWLMGSWPNFLLTTSGSSFLPLSNWFSPFRHQSCPAGKFFIVIGTCTSLTCFWNSYRNAKRFPQSPSFFGNIFQTLMVMTLVFSKVVLGSMSFVYIPYFFPLALIGDFVVVILYNKLCFGHFYGKFDELKKVKCYLQMVLFFSKGPVNLYRYNFTSFVQDA